uniref:ATP synthase peripheral stalk subunit OSCP, mitochondrial n=1 Tax=Anser cygnoides TaxID=8845 RepID=A0A8B9DMZ1_ANSCY
MAAAAGLALKVMAGGGGGLVGALAGLFPRRAGRGEAARGCEATAVRPAGAAAEHVGGEAGVQAGQAPRAGVRAGGPLRHGAVLGRHQAEEAGAGGEGAAPRVDLLAENGRLRYTPGIVSAFGKIMSAYRGEVLCTVTTAQPLDDASLTDLKSALNGFLAKGEVLKLETKTDPSVLGGMIVNIGEKYVDMSTKTKIQKLTKIMRETV